MGGKARQTEGGWRSSMPEMSYALGTPPPFDTADAVRLLLRRLVHLR
jgi:hypothetical protein